MHHRFVVRAVWDDEAGVWSGSSDDIRGLAVEAATIDDLNGKAGDAIVDLIEANDPFPGITSFNLELRAEAPEKILIHTH